MISKHDRNILLGNFAGKIKRNTYRITLGSSLLFLIFFVFTLLIGYYVTLEPISYLPENHREKLTRNLNILNQIELKNPGYTLTVQENGGVSVKTLAGATIMSSLTYYASYEGTGELKGLDNISVMLVNDSTVSITGVGLSGVVVRIVLSVPKDKQKLDVTINTRYSSYTVINRESLVAGFDVSASEVFLKNRQIDRKPFNSEYWLERQGVRFGNGDRSALIYHTPLVSSLQLETKNNMLFFNLEYYLDHPFINIPYQKDGGGKWNDLSKAGFIKGDERDNSFSIYFGNIPRVTPRFMLVPEGFLAGYVFTEHADGGTIKTHRAAYFGSESVSSISNANGGFAGHNIPVTKSVFYADSSGNRALSIRDDPDYPQYLDFLNQLNKTGNYDICLHTPDGESSNRKVLEESIKFMRDSFNTKSWIDHGMYSGQMNRECIVADGLNPLSTYYTADVWERYGTRYFWSPAVEMIGNYSLIANIKKLRLLEVSIYLWKRYLSPEELQKSGFSNGFKKMVTRYHDKGELNSLKTYKGDAFPTPLFWQHFTQTRNFYSWVSDYAKEYSQLSRTKVNTEQKLLKKLVSDWGVFINHGYFVRNGPGDNVLIEHDGKLVINPNFDKILENMDHMRDNGDLYITTIRNLLDYWVLSEKVSLDYGPDGIINIKNGNDQPVKGLSLVVQAKTVLINGEIPKLRLAGENTICWFDLPANKSVTMQVGL